jgi:uncharacterized protein YbbC (DUF1343 family)
MRLTISGSVLKSVFTLVFCMLLISSNSLRAQNKILPADYSVKEYLPLLEGKRVGLIMNQCSKVGKYLLVDTLLKSKVKVVKIFAPEHGFRGKADAGAKVKNIIDKKTGLPVISLYGDNKKPSAEQMADIDVLVYDLQDVGVRFYTYIATMQYAMEACAAYGKTFIVLDRPDPNGFYIDGPVLDTALRSFVGMQPVPIVYGMTCGEYAKMLVGERWFAGAEKLDLKVINCVNYDHSKKYKLPIPPSPNLGTMAAVYSYPSICLFEGTVMSVGRGTAIPFLVWGHPELVGKCIFYFTPVKTPGNSSPLYENRTCYGMVVGADEKQVLDVLENRLRLFWMQNAYRMFAEKDKFFNPFFDKLAGNKQLRQQIINGTSEGDIAKSWAQGLEKFKAIRKKYLLYKDFY